MDKQAKFIAHVRYNGSITYRIVDDSLSKSLCNHILRLRIAVSKKQGNACDRAKIKRRIIHAFRSIKIKHDSSFYLVQSESMAKKFIHANRLERKNSYETLDKSIVTIHKLHVIGFKGVLSLTFQMVIEHIRNHSVRTLKRALPLDKISAKYIVAN